LADFDAVVEDLSALIGLGDEAGAAGEKGLDAWLSRPAAWGADDGAGDDVDEDVLLTLVDSR